MDEEVVGVGTRPQAARAAASVGRRLSALRLDVRPRLTQVTVGKALGKSQDFVSRIEKGAQLPTDQQLRKMLDLYEVDQAIRLDLMAEIREARAAESEWWTKYVADLPRSLVKLIELEDVATKVSIASGGLIPWPFQTEKYMQGVDEFASAEVGAERLTTQHAVRVKRQEIVTRADRPVIVDALVSEAALRPHVGGPAAMREQLDRLIEMADLPNITVRVIPFGAGGAAASQVNLTIIDFPTPNDPGVATMDTGTGVAILDDPKEVRARRRRFDYLCGKAFSSTESLELIRSASKEFL
ncbi:XRE family transcriptional regulator [Kitasatospora xanthocidica]|uniref:XRE family transcriptional regulator n=1 Tax=Kitasatospora xanthocidica TaxID=83382 RepID=A0A373A4I7_9ACTN|nr:XRE family transcriptional regulator [Kitasatospora xanthocidica]